MDSRSGGVSSRGWWGAGRRRIVGTLSSVRLIDLAAEHANYRRWSRLAMHCDPSIRLKLDRCPHVHRAPFCTGNWPGVPPEGSIWKLSSDNQPITVRRPFFGFVDADRPIRAPYDYSRPGIVLQKLAIVPDVQGLGRIGSRCPGNVGRDGPRVAHAKGHADSQLRIYRGKLGALSTTSINGGPSLRRRGRCARNRSGAWIIIARYGTSDEGAYDTGNECECKNKGAGKIHCASPCSG